MDAPLDLLEQNGNDRRIVRYSTPTQRFVATDRTLRPIADNYRCQPL
jgi:hypothetical protein